MSFSSDNSLLSNQLSTNVEFDVSKPEFNDVLNLQYRRIVDSVNSKEGAFYLLRELANFKQIYTPSNPQKNRNSYRMTIDMVVQNGGNINAGATVSVTTIDFTSVTDSVLVYCSCTDINGKLFTLTGPDVYIIAGAPSPGTSVASFTNTTAATITQAMFVAEYTKN
jgi:hypothetical protein